MSEQEGQPGREDEASQEEKRLIEEKKLLLAQALIPQALPALKELHTLVDEDIEVTVRARGPQSRLVRDAVTTTPQTRQMGDVIYNVDPDGDDMFCWNDRTDPDGWHCLGLPEVLPID